MISIVNTECHVPKTFSDLAKIAAWGRLGPVARAIAVSGEGRAGVDLESFSELPGKGLEARRAGHVFRLGRPDWALCGADADIGSLRTAFSVDGEPAGHFRFSDLEKTSARDAVRQVRDLGLDVELLSGDHPEAVSAVAASIGIAKFRAGLLPQQKVQRLEALAGQQCKTLMVGDGLNDGPALSAAYVSMAPSNAADIGRAAADIVFFGQDLAAIPQALRISRAARRLVRQNLVFSVGYNLVVLPMAVTGHVSPLLAAIAMSLSSISVVANALRVPSQTGPRPNTVRRERALVPAGSAA